MAVPQPSDTGGTIAAATRQALQTAYGHQSVAKDSISNPISTSDPSEVVGSSAFVAPRDTIVNRGRAHSAAGAKNASPRGVTPVSTTSSRPKQSFDIERKPSISYGHHRQTSILGGVGHSRNVSLLSSATTSPLSLASPQGLASSIGLASPLSPATILSTGLAIDEDGAFQTHTIRKSPSTSALQHYAGSNGNSPIARGAVDLDGMRRPERMRSTKQKRADNAPTSHPQMPETRQEMTQTVGEYALHHLFTSFVGAADEKIKQFMAVSAQAEPPVEMICGPGADSAFDQLITSLGHINRHKPKTVIDSVMLWRKNKKDDVTRKKAEICPMPDILARIHDAYSTDTVSTLTPYEQTLLHKVFSNEGVISAELRCQVATYILCRALIDIINQTSIQAMNAHDPNFAKALESVVFTGLEDRYMVTSTRDGLSRANLAIRGQLLGVMSGFRLEEIANRFTVPLSEDFRYLSVKAPPTSLSEKERAEWRDRWEEANARTPVLLRSMSWLRFATKPDSAWDTSCNTMQLLAKFFSEVHGRHIKHAYASLFEQILLPVAASGTSEFNMPKWKDTLGLLRPKVAQMLTKADHWPYVYPLQAVLLCVSPSDVFAQQWMPMITAFQPKSRDKSGRSHALKAICRLVWRYLYRTEESSLTVNRKLDEVVKHVFQSSKRFLISTDPVIADPLIQLIRIIGYKNPDLCFRTIIFPLMNYELLSTQKDAVSIENLDPEKTVIGIRAFLAIMTDLERREPPPFPTSFECDAHLDPVSRSNISHRRARSVGFAVSAGRTERLSRPIMSSNLDDLAQDYYMKFCSMLSSLTKICDRSFGGEAVLNEKIAANTPKTPRADAFAFAVSRTRDDPINAAEIRQNYYDLLHVAVEALPRCLSPALPISELVSLLCTGTAHMQAHIASSSAQSLKSIAKQSYAQTITLGFARFIFNFDDKYSTVSDGGLLGPGHIEHTLKLYVELLKIWIDDLEHKTREAAIHSNGTNGNSTQALPPNLNSTLALVDEVESHGLFFLCSPSQAVRAVAVNVLRLVTKFDTALNNPGKRIIDVLEGSSEQVIDVNDEKLTLAERSRLQKGLKSNDDDNSTLVELCSSDYSHDATLWFKVFPNLIRKSLEICNNTVALTRDIVCKRLSHAQPTIETLAQTPKARPPQLDTSGLSAKFSLRTNLPDVVVDQWKLHLIFACTTLTNIGKSQPAPNNTQTTQHARKSSKSSTNTEEHSIATASELFPKVINFVFAPNQAVRDAAVIGLGATNATLYQVLLQAMHPAVQECLHELKSRVDIHQRTVSSPRRNTRTDICRLGVTQLLSLTVHLLKDPAINGETYVMEYMSEFAKHLRTWLLDVDVQNQLEYSKLRTYFCAFIEGLYDASKNLKNASQWLSFQGRLATFTLMENWCGFSPIEQRLREQESHSRRSMLDREHDAHSRIVRSANIEKEKSELGTAALSAMASLCAGPLQFVADNRVLMHFDLQRLLDWIGDIFETASDRIHSLGRKALQNLIVSNPDQPYIMAQSMKKCYINKNKKALSSYFDVVTTVLTEEPNVQVPFWKVLCVGLYTLGNEDSNIRMRTARMLRKLEERRSKTSRLQDLDISVSDKTIAVYKLAQFEVSCRLAKQHPELAFHVFSEFSAYFIELQPDHQRNMVSGMLPWIQTIELTLSAPGAGPTATSYMLLVNLFQITVKSQNTMHNEIQALWQALATGPYAGNVQLILDFIINLCLTRREQNFVVYAKQIVVFLAGTAAGAKVVEYLLMKISPKTMVVERTEPLLPPPDESGLQYTAKLDDILPSGSKQGGLSLGQLSMILLVDLIVSPDKVPLDKVVVLLQVILVSWDQHAVFLQEQARELLVHLIHELVISKIEPGSDTVPSKDSIEDFIELLRNEEPQIMWPYSDSESRAATEDARAVSTQMGYVIDRCTEIFSIIHPNIREEWGKLTMVWATSCAVRHVACRSFQIFRCTSTVLDQQMFADMLARLSNTIADEDNRDFMIFSLEALTTLRCIITELDTLNILQYPQLFWTICACLDTIFEQEFQEALGMLSQLLTKLDLSDPAVLKKLEESKPPRWEGDFRGVHPLLYKGIRSSNSMDKTLALMERLIRLPSSTIIGDTDRLMFTVLANLPRFLQSFDDYALSKQCRESAQALSLAAEGQNSTSLAKTLKSFSNNEFQAEHEFLVQVTQAIQRTFFSALEFPCLVFLLGMVNNQASWFKRKSMEILDIVLRDVDMRRPEITSQGPDLITPLLRLLPTEHCQQALKVLDNVIDMTGTPLDTQHLRMSMLGSHSKRETRKEFSSTQSLHGIPEESGWSIPIPAEHSKRTRVNVHAVFYSLHSLANTGTDEAQEPATTPEINFHKDDEHFEYFPERSATMLSEETRVDGTMGELAEKLDSLDDFFEDDQNNGSPIGSPRYPSGPIEQHENLYVQQALPILHASTTFAGDRYSPARDTPPAMNPGAFAAPVKSYRPGLHNRSITSPHAAMPHNSRSPPRLEKDMLSGDEAGDEPEPFSDDDLSIGRAHTHDNHTVKPAGFRANIRQGLRRLTSTSGNRETARLAASGLAPMKSPKMPKMPQMFLREGSDVRSGEP